MLEHFIDVTPLHPGTIINLWKGNKLNFITSCRVHDDHAPHFPQIKSWHLILGTLLVWSTLIQSSSSWCISNSNTSSHFILNVKLGSTASRMKMSQFYTSQRTQFLKLQFTAKMRVSPLVTLGNDPRKRLLGGGTSSRVLRQLISKLKHSWKKTTGWHKRGPQFSYDFRSYCLNFSDDHGPSNDHIHTPFPPLAWSYIFSL